MKCAITKAGRLEIIPESVTEEYAISKWLSDNFIPVDDVVRNLKGYVPYENIVVKEGT